MGPQDNTTNPQPDPNQGGGDAPVVETPAGETPQVEETPAAEQPAPQPEMGGEVAPETPATEAGDNSGTPTGTV